MMVFTYDKIEIIYNYKSMAIYEMQKHRLRFLSKTDQ